MKAIEKDRTRRYETANGLAAGHRALPRRRAGERHAAERGLPVPQVCPAPQGARCGVAAAIARGAGRRDRREHAGRRCGRRRRPRRETGRPSDRCTLSGHRRARREGAGAPGRGGDLDLPRQCLPKPRPGARRAHHHGGRDARQGGEEAGHRPRDAARPAGEAASHARQNLPCARPRAAGHPPAGKGARLLPCHVRPGAPRHAHGDEQPGEFLRRRRPPGRGAEAARGSADGSAARSSAWSTRRRSRR